jgi:hypothetical protein
MFQILKPDGLHIEDDQDSVSPASLYGSGVTNPTCGLLTRFFPLVVLFDGPLGRSHAILVFLIQWLRIAGAIKTIRMRIPRPRDEGAAHSIAIGLLRAVNVQPHLLLPVRNRDVAFGRGDDDTLL